MKTKEDLEIQKSAVDWLMQNGVSFTQAMGIVLYAIQTDKSIPEAYIYMIKAIK